MSIGHVTSEFHHEFEVERGKLLGRRFLWYTATLAALNFLFSVPSVLILVFVSRTVALRGLSVGAWTSLVLGLIVTLIYLGVYSWARRVRPGRERVLSAAHWLIVCTGSISLLAGVLAAVLAAGGGDADGATRAAAGPWGLVGIFFSHFLACCFMPWTVRESVRPIVPLLALNAAITVWSLWGLWALAAITIVASPFIAVPGAAICFWRNSRFRDQFAVQLMRGRFTQMRRELSDARRIHESLFPRPGTIGALRLDYRYRPMSMIGGDYVYARFTPSDPERPFATPAFNLIVIDVTGHGLAAALTVNRLYGEIERLFGEDPFAKPGDVLRALNRYVNLTLSRHSIYATALCVRIDQDRGTLEHASGGHPPAFLRTVDGRCTRLDTTSMLLGAVSNADFDPAPDTIPFGPGDTLVAYTDGAIEARNAAGKMLSVDGLERLVARGLAASRGDAEAVAWAEDLIRAVDLHRDGPPADDTLLVEVSRIVTGPQPVRTVMANSAIQTSGPATMAAITGRRR